MQVRRLAGHALALLLGAASLTSCSERSEAPRATGPAATVAADDATQPGIAADAGYRLYQFRSEEDPTVAGDPTVCPAAPHGYNVQFNASLWTTNARASDGLTVTNANRKIGTATACAKITNFAFPPGNREAFYAAFDTPAGRFVADGTCELTSNNLPEPKVVIAGCTLRIVDAPVGFTGGEATSASIFNPFRVPGVSTGSYWTVLVYGDPVS